MNNPSKHQLGRVTLDMRSLAQTSVVGYDSDISYVGYNSTEMISPITPDSEITPNVNELRFSDKDTISILHNLGAKKVDNESDS